MIFSTKPTFGGSTSNAASNLDENGKLPRATPESVGIPSGTLTSALATLDKKIRCVDAVLVLRRGRVVCEARRPSAPPNEPRPVYSASKSFVSTAIGFAATEGLVSLDLKIVDVFPEDVPDDVSENLKKTTIRDLLEMASGHAEEPPRFANASGFYDRETPRASDDQPSWIQSFMRAPAPFAPGTRFVYNTPGSHLAAAALEKITGESLRDFLAPRLFAPLQIAPPVWERAPDGYSKGGSGLYLTAEDLAKFGQFYLQKGVWNGERLLPEAWVDAATSKRVDVGADPDKRNLGYGYQFWIGSDGSFRADGKLGQLCVVMPRQDAVVVILSDTLRKAEEIDVAFNIFASDARDAPLPEDPVALGELRAAELAFNAPQEGASGSLLVPLALDGARRVVVYLPNGYLTRSRSYPVAYVAFASPDVAETERSRKFFDECFARRPEQKRVVVIPEGRNRGGGYGATKWFETDALDELIRRVEAKFRCERGREFRAIVAPRAEDGRFSLFSSTIVADARNWREKLFSALDEAPL